MVQELPTARKKLIRYLCLYVIMLHNISTTHYRYLQAGLYSAVLTAFIIESYKSLQQDPQDVMA